MARLSTKERSSLPSSEFAGPGRSFPIPDKVHAEKAIQLAPRALHAGHITAAQEGRIVARARRKLHESAASPHATGDAGHLGHNPHDHVMVNNAHPHQSHSANGGVSRGENHGFAHTHITHSRRDKAPEHHPAAGLED